MRIHGYGDTSVLHLDEVPQPSPRPGEVLIRVAATSFNPSEIGVRRGYLPVDLPYIIGGDVAGTVVAVGEGVRTRATGVGGQAPSGGDDGPALAVDGQGRPRAVGDGMRTPWEGDPGRTGAVGDGVRTLAVGDRVVGLLDGGAAAEFVAAPANRLVAAPASIPLAHAAALPIAGLTAWQAVFEHAGLKAGQRVLINGAGGGVGGYAVQLAKHAGAHVIATASPRSADTVRRLGADEVIGYPVTALAEPVDAVLHLVPVDATALLPLVRSGGVLVSITLPVEPPGMRFVARNDPDQLAALVALVDAGVVRLDISASRPLADLPAVHREAEAGQTRGKIIITL